MKVAKRRRRREEGPAAQRDCIGLAQPPSPSPPDDAACSNIKQAEGDKEIEKQLLLVKYNSIVEGLAAATATAAAKNCTFQQDREGVLPDSLWNEWLWETDALQECHMDLMMNRMHLLGLLICRYRACKQIRFHKSNATLLQIILRSENKIGSMPVLWLFDEPVRQYSLRQLMDTVLNMQASVFFLIHCC